MKKFMFVFVGLFLALTSCQREAILSPDSSSSSTTPSTSGSSSSSSSSSSVAISLTTAQRASVNAVIASKYAGYSIKEAEKEVEHGVIYYKVTIVSGSNKIRLLFNSSWQFIGEKN
jgi:hypothetical protein